MTKSVFRDWHPPRFRGIRASEKLSHPCAFSHTCTELNGSRTKFEPAKKAHSHSPNPLRHPLRVHDSTNNDWWMRRVSFAALTGKMGGRRAARFRESGCSPCVALCCDICFCASREKVSNTQGRPPETHDPGGLRSLPYSSEGLVALDGIKTSTAVGLGCQLFSRNLWSGLVFFCSISACVFSLFLFHAGKWPDLLAASSRVNVCFQRVNSCDRFPTLGSSVFSWPGPDFVLFRPALRSALSPSPPMFAYFRLVLCRFLFVLLLCSVVHSVIRAR